MNISSNFDSGKIKVLDSSDFKNIRLEIPKDTKADFFQWFHFLVKGAIHQECVFNIENAGESSYPEGWENYKAVASYDKETWFRVPTSFEDGKLIISHTPEYNSVYYSYFAPYTYEQHLNMVHAAQMSPECELSSIGHSVEKRNIDMLTIGEDDTDKKKIWIIARQHPGESMAEWFIQGLVSRLLDPDDAVSRQLLNKACFYIVPNVNIDGSINGNLRANSAGENLNREWANPCKEKSPEVYYVRAAMDKYGCDLNLDIHGDETLPYNFISGIEGIPSFDKRLKDLTDTFISSWISSCPDFQDDFAYPKNAPGTANLNICSKAIGERYKCLSLTIEMPFKDNDLLPDPEFGWSSARSETFGESMLHPILQVVNKLR